MSTHLWVFKWCKCVADTFFIFFIEGSGNACNQRVAVFQSWLENYGNKVKNRLFCQLQGWVSNCRFSPNCLFWPLILAHEPDQHLQGVSLSRFLAPFWMQTSLFISHLFINRTFHRQTKYTFEYRNMSLVANHSNNQSQLITEWKKGKEMAAPPFPIPVLPSIWDGHWHIYVVHTYLGCSFCLFSGAA